LVAQLFEEGEEALDIALPGVRALMDELGEVALPDGPELEQALAHEVEPLAGAGHRGELGGPLPGEIAHRATGREARVRRCVVAARRDDLHAVGIEAERRR